MVGVEAGIPPNGLVPNVGLDFQELGMRRVEQDIPLEPRDNAWHVQQGRSLLLVPTPAISLRRQHRFATGLSQPGSEAMLSSS